MSQSIDKEKVTFLLYLDDPYQAEILDYLSGLSPSRKGEVLRQILVSGWSSFKRNMNLESEVVKTVRVKQKPKKVINKRKEPPRYPDTTSPTEVANPVDNQKLAKKVTSDKQDEEMSAEDRRLMEEYGEISSDLIDSPTEESRPSGKDKKESSAPMKSITPIDDDDDDDIDDLDRLKMKFGG